MLTRRSSFRIPPPPTMWNHGNVILSLSELARFLAEQAEALGVAVLPETAAEKLLVQHGRVLGVRTGDRGRGRHGEALTTFEPGSDVVAGVTVLAEGTQGLLTSAAIDHFRLEGENPQIWALGVKEVWRVPRPLRKIVHTLGWPLRTFAGYGEFGGSFIYPMGDDVVAIGFVAGLEARDVEFSVHDVLQEFKTHRLVWDILNGGERGVGREDDHRGRLPLAPATAARAGAAARRRGCGTGQRAAAEGDPLRDRVGPAGCRSCVRGAAPGRGSEPRRRARFYDDSLRKTRIWKELYEVRNMRQAFDRGFYVGGALASMMTVTKGKMPNGRFPTHLNDEAALIRTGRAARYPKPDGKVRLRQAVLGLRIGQPHARRPAEPSPGRPSRSTPRGGGVGVDVPGARVRGGPRPRKRHGHGRGDAVELRPVRGDLCEGWASDAAGRRLGAGVHADLSYEIAVSPSAPSTASTNESPPRGRRRRGPGAGSSSSFATVARPSPVGC